MLNSGWGGFVHTGSLQETAGVCETGPELRHSASAGGGCAVGRYWLRVGPLHQTTETARQLPGLQTLLHYAHIQYYSSLLL